MGVTAIPYDSNGNFSLVSGYLAVSGQTILASQHNPPLEDIASSMSEVLLRSGAAPMGGNLNMNGFKLANLGEPTEASNAATKAYIDAAIAAVSPALVPTGARQGFFRTTAPSGWVKGDGGTIGSAASGATTRANSDTLNLFTLFWDQFSNTILPIQTSAGSASTRGASAAADFAANKRLPVFDLRREYDRGADDSRGYDATLTVGASHTDAIKNHKHPGTTAGGGAHTPTIPKATNGGGDGAQNGPVTSGNINGTLVPDHTHTFITDDNTAGSALETRVRTTVTLHCIKL